MDETYMFKEDVNAFYKTFHELFRELKALNMLSGRYASDGFFEIANFHFRSSRYDSALYYYQKALHAALPTFKTIGSRGKSN